MKYMIGLILMLLSLMMNGMYTDNEDNTKKSPAGSPKKKHLEVPKNGSPKKNTPFKQNISVTVSQSPTLTSSNSNSTRSKNRSKTHLTNSSYASSWLKTVKKTYRTYMPQARSSLLNNMHWIIIGCGIAGLCYIYRQLILGNLYLKDSSRWAMFKPEISLRSLREIPESTFADELLLAIHRKYISQDNPLNTIEPMATFLYDIEQEEAYLTYLHTLYARAKMIHAHRLLSQRGQLYESIPARLERLGLLKEIFIGWASQMKAKCCHSPLETF